MRLLHTSDWHLGVTLEGMSMLEHQRAAIGFITDVVHREQVDAVLISGDVYDRSLPSVEAVALFEDALVGLAKLCTVIVSSGNHDSAIRLGFGSQLFSDRLHLRTSVDRLAQPVVLCDEFGPVHIYGIPYLEPDLTRHKLADEPVDRSHEAVLGAAMARIRADLDARSIAEPRPRSVVLAHAFITGSSAQQAQRSDSERDIRVGNVDSAPASLFEGVDYVALGHLHGPQQPKCLGGTVVRYSGSPLRYSFSEVRHTKSVTLVDLGPDGVKSVSTVDIPQPRPMAETAGTFAELLDDANHREHLASWVKVIVTDPVRPENMVINLKDRFDHLVTAYHRPAGGSGNPKFQAAAQGADPMQVLIAFLREATGDEPADALVESVRSTFEAMQAERVSA